MQISSENSHHLSTHKTNNEVKLTNLLTKIRTKMPHSPLGPCLFNFAAKTTAILKYMYNIRKIYV